MSDARTTAGSGDLGIALSGGGHRAAQNPRGAVIASAMSPTDVINDVLDPERLAKPPADVVARANDARNYLTSRFPGENFPAFPGQSRGAPPVRKLSAAAM